MKQQYRVYYKKLTKWQNPEDVFVSLFGQEKNAFWLDSSKVEKGFSRFSYMGKASKVIHYSLTSQASNIFSYLEEQLALIQTDSTHLPFDFVGGFVGYFGYELKALCGAKNTSISEYPDSLWYFIDKLLVFDHEEKEMYLVCLSDKKTTAEKWYSDMQKKFQISSARQAQNKNFQFQISKRKSSPLVFHLRRNKKKYLENIQVCKGYFKKGDSYQICLTNTLTVQVDSNPLDIYRVLRQVNPAPYGAYIRHNDLAILCSSPERFLKINQEGWVESKPIKGTIKRSSNVSQDEKLAQSLQTSEKDQAENLMIVDLVRNDLGKVCQVGSISVPKLMAIESYQTLHQLVSTVRGKLKKDVSAIDCIKACFPGGSMTGAPKLRTMEIINTIEKKTRGIYSGALGFLSANGSVDLNIIIRTMIVNKDKITIGAGGAVLIQSDPEKEYEEMLLKAQALIKALMIETGARSYEIKGDDI